MLELRVIYSKQSIQRRLHINIIQVKMRTDTFTSGEDVIFALKKLENVRSGVIFYYKSGKFGICIIELIRSIFGRTVVHPHRIHFFSKVENILQTKTVYLFADGTNSIVRLQN